MKRKTFLMLAALLGGMAFTNVVVAEEVSTGGTIKFAQKLTNGEPAGQQCTISITKNDASVVYNFRTSDISCGNDVVSFFRVDNAPSGVLFQLRSDAPLIGKGECAAEKDTRWIFRLRTTRQKTTTGWISIPGLRGRPDKNIVDVGGGQIGKQKG